MRINYAAVVLAAVVHWILGAVWYGVLFGKPWMALEGLKTEQLQQISPAIPYIVAMIANIVMAYALAQLCAWRDANNVAKAVKLGVLMWFGFVATTSLTTYMFEGRPLQLFLINYGYSFVGLMLMGVVLGAWKKKTL